MKGPIRVYTTDDPIPLDFPLHVSRVRISDESEEICERVQNLHSHEYLQLLLVLDGCIEHTVEGVALPIQAMQWIPIPAFQKHRDRYELGAEVVTVSFLPSVVDSLFSDPYLIGRSGLASECLLKGFRQRPWKADNFVAWNLEGVLQVLDELSFLMVQLEDRSEYGRSLARASFLKLLAYLHRDDPREGLGDGPSPIHARIERVQGEIERRYPERLKVEDLISTSGLSPTHFRRYFKEVTGKPCLQYINELRIYHSIGWMRESERSLKQISSDVGFQDFESFHRAFKRIKGINPQKFRASLTMSG